MVNKYNIFFYYIMDFENLFGPLTKEHCQYFLFFSVIGFIFMILAILTLIALILKSKKSIDINLLTNVMVIIIGYFLTYYSNRLLYTICYKTL